MEKIFHKKILNTQIYVWKMTSSYEDQIKNPLLNSTRQSHRKCVHGNHSCYAFYKYRALSPHIHEEGS